MFGMFNIITGSVFIITSVISGVHLWECQATLTSIDDNLSVLVDHKVPSNSISMVEVK